MTTSDLQTSGLPFHEDFALLVICGVTSVETRVGSPAIYTSGDSNLIEGVVHQEELRVRIVAPTWMPFTVRWDQIVRLVPEPPSP